MIDQWETSVGNLMPWVPYSKSELTGLAFACSRDFLRVQLRMGGCTEAQIDDYFAYLATLPDDEPETTAEEREANRVRVYEACGIPETIYRLNGPILSGPDLGDDNGSR